MTFDYNIGGTNNSWYLPANTGQLFNDLPLARKYIYNSDGTGAGYRILCTNGTATNFYIEGAGRYIYEIYQGGAIGGKLYYVDISPYMFVSKLIVNASGLPENCYTIERTSISDSKNNIKVTINSGQSEYLCIYEFRDF